MLLTDDRVKLEPLAGAVAEDARHRYATDPWAWLTEQVITVDEATQRALPWPADKPYLQEVLHALQTERLLVLPKSRRMLVTWLLGAWGAWHARHRPHHAVFYQSENEEKAAFIVDKRCAFIEDHLRDPCFRLPYKSIKTAEGLIGKLTYRDTGSYLWAIPQGDSAVRTFTFSILVMDEADFQPEGRAALQAALPIAEKGAQLILTSSSNGPVGVVAGLCREVGFSRFA